MYIFFSFCGITACGSASLKRCVCKAASPLSQSPSPDSQCEEWESLGDIRVVQGEAEPCAEITLKGKKSKYSGTYTLVQGEWRDGYQVTLAGPYFHTFPFFCPSPCVLSTLCYYRSSAPPLDSTSTSLMAKSRGMWREMWFNGGWRRSSW